MAVTVTPLDEEEIPAGLLAPVEAGSGKAKVDLPKALTKPAGSAEKSAAKLGERALDEAESEEIAPEEMESDEASLDNIESDKKAEQKSAAAVVQAAAGVPAA